MLKPKAAAEIFKNVKRFINIKTPVDACVRRLGGHRVTTLLSVVVLWLATPWIADAQRTAVRGQVTDSGGVAVGGAVAEILGSQLRVVTHANGRFALSVPAGTWLLRTTRIGFRPDTTAIVVADTGAPIEMRVSLRPAPTSLAGITVDAPGSSPLTATVTTETVRQAPPLGEADVFRAVVLLPMVSQPNDLKGRIHLAGGASDETGISLDGHPLQDPFHLLGVLGAFNVAALDHADVLLHSVPIGAPGRLSGLIDLRTREPSSSPEREAVVSLLSSSVTASQTVLGIDVVASARVTYLDKIVRALSNNARIGGDEVPLLGYHDGILKAGRSFGDARIWRVEALGFRTHDAIGVSESLRREGFRPLGWGEQMLGVRAVGSLGAWDLSTRASMNRAFLQLDSSDVSGTFARTRRDWRSGGVEIIRRAIGWRWTTGATVDDRRHTNAWQTGKLSQQIFSPNTPGAHADRSVATERAGYTALTAQRGRTAVTAGVRAVSVVDASYAEPRVVLGRAMPFGSVEIAAERRHQFFADVEEPIEGNVSPPMLLLSRPRVADVVGGAVDVVAPRRFDRVSAMRIAAFHKRYGAQTRVIEDSAAAGRLVFTRLPSYARGVAVSGRARWREEGLVQWSYTFQQARERVDGVWFPTAWDAPHDVTIFAAVPSRRGWSLTAAYRLHSGRAVTPVDARVFVPSEEMGTSLRGRLLPGTHNSVRVPPYNRLDLGARRSWRARGAEWTLFAQMLNLLNRANAIDYDWEQFEAVSGGSRPTARRRGLPILPTFGVEARW